MQGQAPGKLPLERRRAFCPAGGFTDPCSGLGGRGRQELILPGGHPRTTQSSERPPRARDRGSATAAHTLGTPLALSCFSLDDIIIVLAYRAAEEGKGTDSSKRMNRLGAPRTVGAQGMLPSAIYVGALYTQESLLIASFIYPPVPGLRRSLSAGLGWGDLGSIVESQ